MMKTDRAKKWGGSVTMSLTDFLEEGRLYDIFDAVVDGDRVVIIRSSKIPRVKIDFIQRDSGREFSHPRLVAE
jgi:hypothetical protein